MKERIDKLRDAGLTAEAAVEWLKFNDGIAVYTALAASNNAKVIMMDTQLSPASRPLTSEDITLSIIQADEVQSPAPASGQRAQGQGSAATSMDQFVDERIQRMSQGCGIHPDQQ